MFDSLTGRDDQTIHRFLALLTGLPDCAAPWYVYNTLMKSERRTDDPQKADVIFVYDYCRLMWALSEEHAAHHW